MKSKLVAYECDSSTLDYVVIPYSHLRLKEQLKEAMDKLGRLRETRERQKEMVKAIVNQRDMYQRLLAQATPLPTAGDEVRTFIHTHTCMHTHTHTHTHTPTHTNIPTHRFIVQFTMMYSHTIRISQYLMELPY